MSDGTRFSDAAVRRAEVLRPFCEPDLLQEIELISDQGRSLLSLVAIWSHEARGIVARYEVAVSVLALPDDLAFAVARYAGIGSVFDLTSEMAASCERVADRPEQG